MTNKINEEKLINKRIIDLRNELKLSFRDLEKLTGISRSSLQRYEQNYYQKLTLTGLEKIAAALKVTPSYILGHESKNITSEIIQSINGISQLVGYEIYYDFELDSHVMHVCCPTYVNHSILEDRLITEEDVLSIHKTLLDFTKFQLSTVFDKSPIIPNPLKRGLGSFYFAKFSIPSL